MKYPPEIHPLRAVIIDDEPPARKALDTLLSQQHTPIEVVGWGHDVESGKAAIVKLSPDVVFLDIEMPGGSGFDLLEQSPTVEFALVVVTAYRKFALQAIKAAALDYLLKPVSTIDLENALTRLHENSIQKTASSKSVFLENMQANDLQKIIVPSEDGFEVVVVKDIMACQAQGVYTRFLFADGQSLLASRPLKEYEGILPSAHFFRVHKSHLVNLHFVKKYRKGRSGFIALTNGMEVPLARSRKAEFLEKLFVFVRQ